VNPRRFALLALVLAACQAAPATPTATVLSAPSATPLTLPRIAPTQTPRPIFASLTPSPTPSIQPTETAVPAFVPSATLAAALAPADGQHLVFEWPLLYGAAALNRVYPYGGTNGGRLQVHLGDDLVSPSGTPILAAAEGTVFYAGSDFTTRFGPYANYYGNLVVLRHPFLSPDGQPVYTLYGHMDQVLVSSGQEVRQGDTIGTVGASGIALGPHLHFEVRLGTPLDYTATRNPELWLRPPDDYGVLAGRVSDLSGATIRGIDVVIRSRALTQTVQTYAAGAINSDDVLNENFALGNLPPGEYTVAVRGAEGRERVSRRVSILPGQVTWVELAEDS
jgi:murein DD-endopeptidase MepM/ murein hydrolase activator NlpD